MFGFRPQFRDLQLTELNQFYGHVITYYVMIGFVMTTNLSELKIAQLRSKNKRTFGKTECVRLCVFTNFSNLLTIIFDPFYIPEKSGLATVHK